MTRSGVPGRAPRREGCELLRPNQRKTCVSPSHLVTAVPLSYLLQPSRGEGLGEVMQGSEAEESPSPAPGGLRLTKGEVITRAKGTVTCRGLCQGSAALTWSLALPLFSLGSSLSALLTSLCLSLLSCKMGTMERPNSENHSEE